MLFCATLFRQGFHEPPVNQNFNRSFVWSAGTVDITAEDEIPVGKNVLELTNIFNSANYTCIAASTLGQIEAVAMVKVQCEQINEGKTNQWLRYKWKKCP